MQDVPGFLYTFAEIVRTGGKASITHFAAVKPVSSKGQAAIQQTRSRMETGKKKLLGMTLSELKEVAQALGMPSFAGGQTTKWSYQRQVTSIGEMTNISRSNRERLIEKYEIGCIAHIDVQYLKDRTVKHLFPTTSGKFIETVFIPDDDRTTLRVSCQARCKMSYLFCQTGKQRFEGNLTYTDILNQAYSLPRCDKLTNIVLMGQGESMDNSDNILRVTQVMTTDYDYIQSPKRITVSSVGVKGGLKCLPDESDCHVVISLHSTLPGQCSMLIPAERGMPVEQTADLSHDYDFAHQRQSSFEYIVSGGLNDMPMHICRVIDLLHGLDCRVNLIRFHQIPNVPLKGADEQKMENLRNYLTSRGVFTAIRASRRQDIFVACGLLSTAKKAST